MEQCSFRR